MSQKELEKNHRGYSITVTGGANVQLTDAMRQHAIDKVAHIERFTDRIIDVRVFMDIQGIDHRVKIVMKVGHLKVASHAVSTDMYASIDAAVKKIEKQLKRNKQRITSHQARALKSVDINVNVLLPNVDDELSEINEEIEQENLRKEIEKYSNHHVVDRQKTRLSTLNQEEAVLHMDLSGDAFLLYRSEEDLKLKLMYRRKDDHYAIIEPETNL